MKHITHTTLLVLPLVLLASLVAPGFGLPAGFQAVVHAAAPQTLVLDVAVDCNTVASGETRGATYIINGKLFPGGTLPTGDAGNDPVKPFKGVAPIGEYLVRGQHAISLNPPADAYYMQNYVSSSFPLGLATAYFLLNGGKSALITEGYDLGPSLPPPGALLTIIGGIGDYRGVTGDLTDNIIGSNASGCANSRVTFTFAQPPATPAAAAPTAVISGSPVIETLYREISLDGSASKNDSGSLKYSWTTEGTGVAIIDSTSPQTRIQIQSGQADYPVTLTVTNSAGQSASAKVIIHFIGR